MRDALLVPRKVWVLKFGRNIKTKRNRIYNLMGNRLFATFLRNCVTLTLCYIAFIETKDQNDDARTHVYLIGEILVGTAHIVVIFPSYINK